MLSPLIVVRQNLQVMKRLRLGLGYGLSMRSQREWARIESEERTRQAVVDKAHAMIEWAHSEYEGAKAKHHMNIKVFAELTLHWSAQRVLSTHKDFDKLCAALRDERTWKMLSRKERAFIADAIGVK